MGLFNPELYSFFDPFYKVFVRVFGRLRRGGLKESIFMGLLTPNYILFDPFCKVFVRVLRRLRRESLKELIFGWSR